MSNTTIELDHTGIAEQINALQDTKDQLTALKNNYKAAMDAMSASWEGSSGRSFAEAANRINADFIVHETVLEKLVSAADLGTRDLFGQDEASAGSVASGDAFLTFLSGPAPTQSQPSAQPSSPGTASTPYPTPAPTPAPPPVR